VFKERGLPNPESSPPADSRSERRARISSQFPSLIPRRGTKQRGA
jgi:hypothetical protein